MVLHVLAPAIVLTSFVDRARIYIYIYAVRILLEYFMHASQHEARSYKISLAILI